MRLSDVDQLFTPAAVAVFGASDSPGSVGGRSTATCSPAASRASCYAINPKYEQVAGGPATET
jgi:acetyltransferase